MTVEFDWRRFSHCHLSQMFAGRLLAVGWPLTRGKRVDCTSWSAFTFAFNIPQMPFKSMYPVPELPTSTSTSTSTFMAIATEQTNWLHTHDSFVRSLAKESEDAKTILMLLETEFPTLHGKVNEEWVPAAQR